MSELYLRDEANGTGNGAEPVNSTNPFPVVLIPPGGGVGGGSQFRQLDSNAGTLAGVYVPTSYLVGSRGAALFPDAAALSDSLANPTTPQIGSNLLVWDGTQWLRARGVNDGQNPAGGTGAKLVVVPMGADSNGNFVRWTTLSADGSATTGNFFSPVEPVFFNGTTLDRQYNNSSATLLASAAAGGATRTSADQTNFNGRGVRISIDVTAYTSGTLTVTVSTKDSLTGVYTVILTSAGLVATGHTELRIYPGIAVTANVTANDILSRTWRVNCTAVTATYSISADTLL